MNALKWKRAVYLAVGASALGLAVGEASPVTATPRPAVSAKKGGGTAPGFVPPQIKDLRFLIGRFRCPYTPVTPGQEQTVEYFTNTWGLGGSYVNESQYIAPSGLRGSATYGWDPVGQRFFAQYHDTWGTNGTEVSTGRWQDGHLIFTGSVLLVTAPSETGVANGINLTVKDDYTVSDSGYVISEEYTLPSGTTLHGSYDCRRI